MELLEILKQVPVPVLLIVLAILLIVTIVIAVQYIRQKGLDGIRADVYQLILTAEHMYNESGAGKQKFEWVIQQARGLFAEMVAGDRDHRIIKKYHSEMVCWSKRPS